MNAANIPLDHLMLLACLIFVIGLVGIMTRRNVLYILMSLEIVLNAVCLAFVAAGAHWGEADGQIMFLLILTLAASEVSVGLGLILQIHRKHDTLDMDRLKELKG
ncbi:MAG TPA: NADH-quinone oxidoreductase subunit NuoK [Dongiaceae bacterium]|nr:NADH-quinone oxidoreductase subunit NuoK [Dongiaceae bacterium]